MASYRRYAAPVRPHDWSVGALRARCAVLRSALVARGTPEDACAAVWPGGAENDARGVGAWITCYGALRALHAAQAVQSGPTGTQAAARDAALRAALADAMADRPVYVECTDGVRRGVYPKSYHALEEMTGLGRAVHAATLLFGVEQDAVGAGVRAPALRSLAVRAWCAIVTHPEPGLPFADDADDPALPAWTDALAPQDLLALVEANEAVNVRRTAVLCAAFPPKEGTGSRLSFEGFLGTFAADQHVDPYAVLRRWSLGRVLATAVAQAVTSQEAQARADAQRAAEAPAAPAPSVIHA